MTQSLNIILLTDSSEPTGGVSMVVLEDAATLAAMGYQVTLFTAVGTGAAVPKHERIRHITLGQHEVLTDPHRLRAMALGLWNSHAATELRRFLATCDPQRTVIHLHSWSKALSSSVVRTAIDSRFAIVCTLHDYFAACPNGGFYNYQTQSICRLRPMSTACVSTHCDARNYMHKLWRVTRQAIQQGPGHLPHGITSFIALSPISLQVLKPYLGDAPIHLVPNIVRPSSNAVTHIGADAPFIMVGRLAREKGVDLMIQACIKVGEIPRFVGNGPVGDQAVTAFGSTAISGWLTKAAVEQEMRRAYALVLPSRWYEAQPTIIQEAAAMGIPAIVADGTAACDLIENGVTGVLFRHADSGDLARILHELRQNPSLVQEMGRNAHSAFWHDFDRRVYRRGERLAEIYKEAINKGTTLAD